MFLSIAICEDEVSSMDIIKGYLNKIINRNEIDYNINLFYSAEELIKNYPNELDILLLDIKMDGIDGMEAAKKIRTFDKDVEIIFITSMINHILDAFEVRAYRYLLKPIDYRVLKDYINSFINEFTSRNNEIYVESKYAGCNSSLFLKTSEIIYIEVMKKTVTIYTEKRKHILSTSLSNLENKLKDYGFFRCHQSFLVNLRKVIKIERNIAFMEYDDKLIEIPISKYKAKDFRNKVTLFLGGLL
ncbi:LytR/AlgR family response regulator transcription factor [Clostridioides sp. ES-S-0048-02]|uniref:LytR/AlgR family response regulator transcription factor n=1 Tax=Clostridioides sp. ES-S-0048-02 TaxID=2770777 RepID=UPI001D0FE154|nr:response regulator transcription factor [Clostridioides sp. ES-S-0048-02]